MILYKNLFCNTTLICSFVVKAGIIDSIAEQVASFVVTNTLIKIVLAVFHIPIYIVLAKLFFGDLKRWWREEKILIIPDWIVVTFFRHWYRGTYSDKNKGKSEANRSLILFIVWIALYFVEYMLIKVLFLA